MVKSNAGRTPVVNTGGTVSNLRWTSIMKNKTRTVNKETLWREYAEAGNLCRSYEVLSRTSLAIFATFATAVVAYLLRESTQTIPNIILSLLGLIISVLTLTMMYRVREFYHVAKTRAVEIEKELHMDLYHRLDDILQ